VEGSGFGVFKDAIPLAWGTEGNHERPIRIDGLRTKT
jgi:hypothetical protein